MFDWKDFEDFFKYVFWPKYGQIYTEIFKAVSIFLIARSMLNLAVLQNFNSLTNAQITIVCIILLILLVNIFNSMIEDDK